jgi:hypothetical protein
MTIMTTITDVTANAPLVTAPIRITSNNGGAESSKASAMAHFADKHHVEKQSIDRVESAVLLSLIGGGLAFCVLGSAIYDIGRVFSVW